MRFWKHSTKPNCVFCGQQKLTGWGCMFLVCKAIGSWKSCVFLYLLWSCNKNEVIIVKLPVLTVRMTLRSLKAAGFFHTSWNHKHFMAQDELLGPNINFRKKKKKKIEWMPASLNVWNCCSKEQPYGILVTSVHWKIIDYRWIGPADILCVGSTLF